MSDTPSSLSGQPLPAPPAAGDDIMQVAINELPQWNTTEELSGFIAAGINARREFGLWKYGVPLKAHNGRDSLADAWDEAVDLFVYLYQAEEEDPGTGLGDGPLYWAFKTLEDLAQRRIARGDSPPAFSVPGGGEWQEAYVSVSTGLIGVEECRSVAVDKGVILGGNALIVPQGKGGPHDRRVLKVWSV
jgi:hypothetical protein